MFFYALHEAYWIWSLFFQLRLYLLLSIMTTDFEKWWLLGDFDQLFQNLWVKRTDFHIFPRFGLCSSGSYPSGYYQMSSLSKSIKSIESTNHLSHDLSKYVVIIGRYTWKSRWVKGCTKKNECIKNYHKWSPNFYESVLHS